MDQLIARLAERIGVDDRTAQALIAIVIQFLAREAPAEAMEPLFAVHPWARALAAEAPEADVPATERHFGGMARLMRVADRMMALGLTMPQVQTTVRETVGYARETVGPEAVDTLVRAVPGLRQVA